MFNESNSVSISVPGDGPDKSERWRAGVRRKRKKPTSFQFNNKLPLLLVRILLKWWAVLLLVLAVGLLSFEASRIGFKLGYSPTHLNSEIDAIDSLVQKKLSIRKVSEGNLNRLDPTRCLKILPSEELENLDIPVAKRTTYLMERVVYLSRNDMSSGTGEGNISYPQLAGTTRFNLFTGNQTFDQREQSFKLNETPPVHCGLYDESGGFKISEEDKKFMQMCKVVVSTCAFGGGDGLYPVQYVFYLVCYVAFWDEITLSAQESQERKVGKDNFIGKWRIVVVRNLPFADQRLNGKIPKMLGHRVFPEARYSIWVDSKSQFRRDPLGVLEALLWSSNSVLAISEHGARSSVYDEAKAVVKKHKATPEEVDVQLSQYRHEGLPEDKRFNGKKALSEASVILREHTPLTNLLMCLWFNEVVLFTSRDQLSFPYVLWRLNAHKNINMFPVCTPKDLVNSMGHLRKAKPLVA